MSTKRVHKLNNSRLWQAKTYSKGQYCATDQLILLNEHPLNYYYTGINTNLSLSHFYGLRDGIKVDGCCGATIKDDRELIKTVIIQQIVTHVPKVLEKIIIMRCGSDYHPSLINTPFCGALHINTPVLNYMDIFVLGINELTL